jgi:hypothetical protein
MTRQHWLGALVAILGGILTIPGAYLLNWVTLTWLPPGGRELVPGLAAMPVLALGLLVALGMLCAFLVHSWRALYIIPVGYGISWIASFSIFMTVGMGGNNANSDLVGAPQFAVGTFLLLMLVPLLLGAAIGVWLIRGNVGPMPR